MLFVNKKFQEKLGFTAHSQKCWPTDQENSKKATGRGASPAYLITAWPFMHQPEI